MNISKKITLTELVVVIVVVSILLAIVLINFFDLKKKSIANTMAQNISIMQVEVDAYYLKTNRYPIDNESSLNLENPQLINVGMLVSKELQKKGLDLSKIREQYYWVDVFGKVWGSTNNNISSINLISQEDGSGLLEWLIGTKYSGYKIYEVSGYGLVADREPSSRYYKEIAEFRLKKNEEVYLNYAISDNNKTYLFSMIDEYGLEAAPRGKFSNDKSFKPFIEYEGSYEFEIESGDIMYWINFLKEQSTPGESTIEYFFVVKNEEGNYAKEWTKDFFALDSSKGIKIKVVMKGDSEGNKPSLYDLRVVFKYSNDKKLPPAVIPVTPNENDSSDTCPKFGQLSDFNIYSQNISVSQKGKMVYQFKVNDLETIQETLIPRVNLANALFEVKNTELYILEGSNYIPFKDQTSKGKCMVVVYDIEIVSVKPTPTIDPTSLCGENGTTSSFNEKNLTVVYQLYLGKGEFLTKIDRPASHSSWIPKSIEIEVSHKGDPYVKVSNLSQIKDESCVNIIYKYTKVLGYPNIPSPPPIELCYEIDCVPQLCGESCQSICVDCDSSESNSESDGGLNKEVEWCKLNPEKCNESKCIVYEGECHPPICTTDCLTEPPSGPDKSDKTLNDSEWKTVDRLRFFGHGAQGQLTRWYRAIHSDSIISTENSDEISLGDNVRIVYRYAKSSGGYWSKEYQDFTKTGIATSVLCIAYIQVKKTEVNNITEEMYPNVTTMKFFNEKGYLDMSMIKPTLSIWSVKDNNIGREVYSDESNIKWSYGAADPRNKEIVDIQWDGDIRDKYPVGTYEIKARVKNEVEIWSDWVTYELKILQEKPIAKISLISESGGNFHTKEDKFSWSIGLSEDPDRDTIVDSEWINKKSSYPIGEHLVQMRVKDSEGYWSDWTSLKLNIGDKAFKVQRIEAEDTNIQFVSGLYGDSTNSAILSNVNASNKLVRAIKSSGFYVDFKIQGTGFDLNLINREKSIVQVFDSETNEVIFSKSFSTKGPELLSMRNLPLKEYVVQVKKTGVHETNYDKAVSIDYLDVYSSEDKPLIKNVYSRYVHNGIESKFDVNEFSGKIGQVLKTYFTLFNDSNVDIEVFKDGKLTLSLIKDKKLDGGTFRNQSFSWDGKDSNGDFLPSGEYLIKITARGVQGTKAVSEIKISLNNDSPIYRLEAEDTDTSRVYGPFGSNVNTMISSGATFSNGAIREMKTANYATSFKFIGNGFDLKLVDRFNSKVEVIESESGAIILSQNYTTAGAELVSMRLLPQKEYIVKVTKIGANESNYSKAVKIDYLDIYGQEYTPEIYGIYSKNIHAGIESLFDSNMLSTTNSQQLKIYYRILKDSKVTIELLDNQENKISRLEDNLLKDGGSNNRHVFIFNGILNGEALNTGSYSLKVTAIGLDNKSKISTIIPIYIDSEKAAYRLEAESATSASVYGAYGNSTNSKITSFAGASNNKVRQFKTKGMYISFKFTGTGFDLSLPNANEANITVSGTDFNQNYTGGGKKFISMRNLPEQEYVVTVKKVGINYSSFTLPEIVVIDYLDVYE